MAPVIELFHASASDALLQHPHNKDIVAAAGDILKAQDGVGKIYYGVQHEDKATVYLVIAWDSYEAHEKLIKDTETYQKLGGALVTSIVDPTKGPLSMIHVNVTDEPFKAFEAPMLEIVTMTLREGHSKTELEAAIKTLADAINSKASADSSVFHASWGPAREKEDTFVLFVGWASVEAHYNAAKTDPSAVELVKKCKAVSDGVAIHVPLVLA